MENKNLNDIVIEDAENSKKSQLKNILTLLALLFIILVISIVITKLILGGDTDNPVEKHAVTGESTEIESNSTTAASTLAAVGAAAGAAVTSGATAAGDKVKEGANAVANAVEAPSLSERNKTSNTKSAMTDIEANKKETKKVTSEPKASTYSRPKYVASSERAQSNPAPKKETKKTYNPTRGYYIKVGAFKDPSTAIKKIKASKLKYRTIKNSEGLTRVLIGPFYSQKDAADHLAKAKANVAKDAYITKIK